QIYTMLTVGDGLVSQIPALIISTAAGIVVTRNSSGQNMGLAMTTQLFIKPRAVAIVAIILGLLGLIPGLPKLPFFFMGAILGLISWVITKYGQEKEETERVKAEEESLKPKRDNIENLLPLDL